jgi:hypothetical protein
MAVARLVACAALLCALGACASTRDIEDLGSRVTVLETEVGALKAEDRAIAASLAAVRGDVAELRRIVAGTSTLSVQVVSDEMATLFSNSTGSSRVVRLTVRNAPPGGTLKMRTIPVGLNEDLGSVGEAGEVYPELDLSAAGAQRIIRLACGLEIQGRAIGGGTFTVDILVQPDPEPISCDQAGL